MKFFWICSLHFWTLPFQCNESFDCSWARSRSADWRGQADEVVHAGGRRKRFHPNWWYSGPCHRMAQKCRSHEHPAPCEPFKHRRPPWTDNRDCLVALTWLSDVRCTNSRSLCNPCSYMLPDYIMLPIRKCKVITILEYGMKKHCFSDVSNVLPQLNITLTLVQVKSTIFAGRRTQMTPLRVRFDERSSGFSAHITPPEPQVNGVPLKYRAW